MQALGAWHREASHETTDLTKRSVNKARVRGAASAQTYKGRPPNNKDVWLQNAQPRVTQTFHDPGGLCMIRIFKLLSVLSFGMILAACDPAKDLEDPPVDLGNFRLGHNVVVVVDDVTIVPGSRIVTVSEWETALKDAIDARFGRYEGSNFYHISLSVRGYNLSRVDVPGVPTPKTLVDLHARIWDDSLGRMLHEKPHEVQILAAFNEIGVQPSKQDQLDYLAASAAKEVEKWLLEHPEWFESTSAAPSASN